MARGTYRYISALTELSEWTLRLNSIEKSISEVNELPKPVYESCNTRFLLCDCLVLTRSVQ